MISKLLWFLFALCTLNTLLLIAVLTMVINLKRRPLAKKQTQMQMQMQCSALTCGAIDPVSDPAYNMREIAKQSILLEEHLTVKAKFCIDCVTKHFLHMIGLANEASMLAGSNVTRYPHLAECTVVYERLFNQWLADHERQEKTRLDIATELRDVRKQLIAVYYNTST